MIRETMRMRDMLNIDWNKELDVLEVDICWNKLKAKVTEAERACIPTKKIRTNTKTKPIWMDNNTLRKVKKEHSAWNRYQRTKDGQDYLLFARAQNQARWASRSKVREFEKQLAKNIKTNPKTLRSYVNSKVKTRSGVADLYNKARVKTSNNKEKAESLSDFFCKVFIVEDLTNCLEIEEKYVDTPLTNIHIEPQDVQAKLAKLKPHKSPGPDGIHLRVLKELSPALSSPLCLIYSKMIQTSQLPNDFKIGEVIPIFKKGNRHLTLNYRPFSLTSVACKVLESIFRDHIMAHMKHNKPFTKEQHGFLEEWYTIPHFLEVLEYLIQVLNQGGAIDKLFTDDTKLYRAVKSKQNFEKQAVLTPLTAKRRISSSSTWLSAVCLVLMEMQ